MTIEELVKKVDDFCREETMKYRPNILFLYDLAMENAVRLAKEYNADENIVRIGISMMDSKLPYAGHIGTPKEHIKMGVEKIEEFLKDVDTDEKTKENIIKCVEEHHGVEKFYSIESEIVANADTYKFVHPKGVLYYASMLGREKNDFTFELEQLEFKLKEKYNVISLDSVKEELTPYYEFFEKSIAEAKK